MKVTTSILDVEDLAVNGVKATAKQLQLLETVGQAQVPIAYCEGENIITGYNSDGTIHLVTHQWLVDAAAQLEIPRVTVVVLPKEQAMLFTDN